MKKVYNTHSGCTYATQPLQMLPAPLWEKRHQLYEKKVHTSTDRIWTRSIVEFHEFWIALFRPSLRITLRITPHPINIWIHYLRRKVSVEKHKHRRKSSSCTHFQNKQSSGLRD
ncbi:unnamed protein product [Haemonchus placei]|uniref:Integrase_H2C2 domain-containing protein n=1 Tax=Haemonchus placei TaxID=6290 RepID=A0A0N4WFV5_HAEPC|nr:unnamed protein product [Haemonchus placei]